MAGRRSFRSSRAFLIRSADVGETDRRVTFFTEAAGVVSVIAKAARRSRKRFGGGLQKYFLFDVAWSEERGKPPILSSASIIESFWDVVGNWERIQYADYLLELAVSLFPQPGPKRKEFAFLLAGIHALAAGEIPVSVGRKAEAAFLAMGGWGPDLSGCRSCGRREGTSFRFAIADGKLYCKACAGKGGSLLSPGAVRTWRALQAPSPSAVARLRIPKSILEELQAVVPKYLEWNIGKALRSLGDGPLGRNP